MIPSTKRKSKAQVSGTSAASSTIHSIVAQTIKNKGGYIKYVPPPREEQCATCLTTKYAVYLTKLYPACQPARRPRGEPGTSPFPLGRPWALHGTKGLLCLVINFATLHRWAARTPHKTCFALQASRTPVWARAQLQQTGWWLSCCAL